MKCFIAMAFGHPDTDELYDAVIAEILRSRNVEPVRVDRLEHNEDIDDRIIQEIRGADFAIADLSYARPSVYYEAGYAERAIPVVYIIRTDHLTSLADDHFGNYRLHFDLQMKNVIEWERPRDQPFRQRLAMRVDYLLAPIRERKEAKDLEAAERGASSDPLPRELQVSRWGNATLRSRRRAKRRGSDAERPGDRRLSLRANGLRLRPLLGVGAWKSPMRPGPWRAVSGQDRCILQMANLQLDQGQPGSHRPFPNCGLLPIERTH